MGGSGVLHQAQQPSSMDKLPGKGSTKGRWEHGMAKGQYRQWGNGGMDFVGKFLWGNPRSLRDSMVNGEEKTELEVRQSLWA